MYSSTISNFKQSISISVPVIIIIYFNGYIHNRFASTPGIEIEYYLDNRTSSIDVVAIRGNKKTAIEIELNKTGHIQENIVKCIDTDFDLIVIAVYDSSLKKYVENILLTDFVFEENYRKEE